MNKPDLFNQYRPMVESFAWKAARRHNIEVTELRSEAYLIFCEAIKRYDPTKASFSTFLFNRLRTINDYARYFKKGQFYQLNLEEIDDNKNYNLIDTRLEDFEYAMDKLEEGLNLSEDAQSILDFILSREWETPGFTPHRYPRLHSIKKYFKYWHGWMPQRVMIAWEEIRVWWRSGNHLQEV